ncbi:MAG: D-alanyl-D-alanine carboxypeptidase/D-alanyl-D-alanine-endopeptidase [Prosthecobacter sp.]|nr:D-alanyl-D-alanine carboxypeptidase/D-alanyl-D-alanine-endopeptidase [Prosthecobacter sp.]
MKKILLCLLLLALTALFFFLGHRKSVRLPSPNEELSGIFEQASRNPALSGASIGFCLLDAQGEVVFERQSRTSFIPASTLKTLTTATALEKWGPDYRIKTTLLATAAIKEGVIEGDVIIQGGADPMLSLQDLESWARTLHNQGLKKITGRILGDGRLFKGSIYNDFWDWGDLGNGYGSGVSGLNLEHNRYIAHFRPGSAVGAIAMFLGATPEVPNVQWINEVTTGTADSGDGVVIHGGESTHLLHLRGTVPLAARDFQVRGAVPDPESYVAHHLRQVLINAGISVEGAAISMKQLLNDEEPPISADEVLLTHTSPPLLEIITSIHATSDNHETECLYRLLGFEANLSSDEVLREHWRQRGLVFEGLRMEDGCGLARADFIRPLDLARLQNAVGRGPQGTLYRDSLLSANEGHLRWKGGAMSGVRSYTGFINGKSGAQFTFALMANHFSNTGEISALRDAVLQNLQER